MSETQKEIAALPQARQAPIPRGMGCRGQVVWVNMNKKTYHEEGDPYFGRTKNGQYMCKAAANAAGYHMAGERHRSMNGGGYNDNGGYNNGGSMSGSSRHHRRSSGGYNSGGYNNGNSNTGGQSQSGGDTSGG